MSTSSSTPQNTPPPTSTSSCTLRSKYVRMANSPDGPSYPGNSQPLAHSNPRYLDDRAQMIIDAARRAVEKLRGLPPGQKESFAAGFRSVTTELGSKADEMVASRQALPTQLPAPLP